MHWVDAILVTVAVAGWVVALACYVRLRARPTPPPVISSAAPFTPSGKATQAVLTDVSGAIESVRQLRPGLPPPVLYRPHGKHRPADRYRLVGQDGERALYRAES